MSASDLRRRLVAPLATLAVVTTALLTAARADDGGPVAAVEPDVPDTAEICSDYRSFQAALATLASDPTPAAVAAVQESAAQASTTMSRGGLAPEAQAGMAYLDRIMKALGPGSTVADITAADAGSTVADSVNVQSLTDYVSTSCAQQGDSGS